MPEIIHTTSTDEWLALRQRDITSTLTPALFDASPYHSCLQVALIKRGTLPDSLPDNERLKTGRYMESVIARLAAERAGWTIRRLNAYWRHGSVDRMGASFDYEIVKHEDGPGILEVKNVDRSIYYRDWGQGDGLEAVPVHLTLQLQHQLEVADRQWGAIAALIGGNELKIIQQRRDPDIGAAIVQAISAFWTQFDQGILPPYQMPRDAAAVAALYSDGSGAALDATDRPDIEHLMIAYHQAGDRMKSADRDRQSLKAELLTKIGNASRVKTKAGVIACGMRKGGPVSFVRPPARQFRVTLHTNTKTTKAGDTAAALDATTELAPPPA